MMLITRSFAAITTLRFTAADRWCSSPETLQQTQHWYLLQLIDDAHHQKHCSKHNTDIYCSWSMMLITRNIAANTTLIFTAVDRWCSSPETLQQTQHWYLLQLIDDAHHQKHCSKHNTDIYCSWSMMLIIRNIAANTTLIFTAADRWCSSPETLQQTQHWYLLQLIDDAHHQKHCSKHNTDIYCSWSMMLITRNIAANTTLIFTAADRWCSSPETLQQSQHFDIYCSWSMMLITRNITAITTLWDLLQLVDDAHYRKHYSNHSTFEIHCSRSMMLITRNIAATTTLWDLLQLVDDAHYKKHYSNHNTLIFTAAGRWCSLQETLQQSQHFWDSLQQIDDAHYKKHCSNRNTLRFTAAGRWCSLQETLQQSQHFEIYSSWSMMLITRNITAITTLWDLLQLVVDAHYKKHYSNHNTLRFTAAGRWCSLQETLQQSQHFEIYCSWSMMLTTRNIAATATFASKMSTWFQHSYTWWWYISQMKR